jgi:hypothetical protein
VLVGVALAGVRLVAAGTEGSDGQQSVVLITDDNFNPQQVMLHRASTTGTKPSPSTLVR